MLFREDEVLEEKEIIKKNLIIKKTLPQFQFNLLEKKEYQKQLYSYSEL